MEQPHYQRQPLKLAGLALLPLCLGLLFFAASITPSLIPRPWYLQGVLGGLVIGVGFAIGQFMRVIWGWLALPCFNGPKGVRFQFLCFVITLIILLITLYKNTGWQNEIRVLLTMEPIDSAHNIGTIILATIVFSVTVVIGTLVQRLFNIARIALYKLLPAQTANILALVFVFVFVTIITQRGIINPLFNLVDGIFQTAQNLIEPEAERPVNAWQAGSEPSLVSWKKMGKPGRDFVRLGPDSDAITGFTKKPAMNPIRVYVGRAQDPNPDTRAQIALDELLRLNAFERDVLVIASPTGTGWLDAGSHDVLEYLHNGNVATVAVQYSHLQSPVALIFEAASGLEQAEATVRTVYDYWKELPRHTRPKLYIHGLSLGAWSSMAAFNIFRIINDPINGALWAGPPFPSTLWQQINGNREPGSPYTLPIIGDGNLVRYANQSGSSDYAKAPWGDMRLVFLQYASDPIVFFEPGSFLVKPQWMREPAAPDVSPNLSFTPFVTQLQLALDMAISTSVPMGYGHNYEADDYIDAWIAVTAPNDWSDNDIKRLKSHCGGDWGIGCKSD